MVKSISINPRERRFAERSGTQRRPLARRQQLLLYGVARQFGQRVRGVTGKRHRVIALDINHHRLQHAPFAAVDRADDPARRGGTGRIHPAAGGRYG